MIVEEVDEWVGISPLQLVHEGLEAKQHLLRSLIAKAVDEMRR